MEANKSGKQRKQVNKKFILYILALLSIYFLTKQCQFKTNVDLEINFLYFVL